MSDGIEVPDGWTRVTAGRHREALARRYSEDLEVVVSLDEIESGHEVRERTTRGDARAKDTVVGIRDSRAAARELMLKTARDWDDWMLRRPTIGCN